MDSKEFGLVAAQQLFKLQDLHYGFWEKGETASPLDIPEAQTKYTTFLCDYIEKTLTNKQTDRILDVGCGIGITAAKLLQMGYTLDALVPSNWMARLAREKVAPYKDDTKGNVYECNFEALVQEHQVEKYQTVFFSESYQYVDMQQAFDVLQQVLDDQGWVVIFDFFKKDDIPGKSPLGGGHSIGKFYELVKQNGYSVHTDLDVTANMSPNLAMVQELLVDRLLPFFATLDAFAATRGKIGYKLFKFLFRKKLKKMQYKYSEARNQESFEKYKTYRLFVLQKNPNS